MRATHSLFALVPTLALSSTAFANAPSLAEGMAVGASAITAAMADEEPAVASEAPAAAAPAAAADTKARKFLMEIGFRGRMVSVPKSILDIWYFDSKDEGWADLESRPTINGYALGLEFVVRADTANGIFWFEYLDSSMQQGYWDDVEEPPDHFDGDYLVPQKNLGLVAFGADYAYDARLVNPANTKGRFGLSFMIGGGLGVAIMTGQIDRWGPDETTGDPAFKRYYEGEPPDEDKRIPRVLPMVDVNAGLRFTFGERVVWRVEGGLHSMVYYGSSIGILF